MANKCADFTHLSLNFLATNIEAFLNTAPAKTPVSVALTCGQAAYYALVMYTE